jgi:hypothetical protein
VLVSQIPPVLVVVAKTVSLAAAIDGIITLSAKVISMVIWGNTLNRFS